MIFELFYVFFLIGAFTIGGGYAMISLIEQEVVSRGWIDAATFTNMVSISESTPGPIAINMATFVGYKVGGILGSIFATLGVVLPSFIIIILIATILKKLIDYKPVKGILYGFKACVIGLIIATGLYFLYNACYGSYGYINWYSIVIFIIIVLIGFIFKKIKKKAISPYLLIIIGAICGSLVYLFINVFSV